MTTHFGAIEVQKTHMLCPKTGFRQSPYLQETALYLGQSEVFATANEFLHRLLGVDLSGKQIENLCHHYGENLSSLQTEESVVSNEKNADLHYAMVDGSFIMSRDGWVETKLGRVFKASNDVQISEKRKQIMSSDYVAHIGNCTDFCQKFSLRLNHLFNLVFIADGAPWIWNWITTMYPHAVQILDFWHAYEKICQMGALFFKDKTVLTDWCEAIKELLLNDEVDEVIIQIKNISCHGDLIKSKDTLTTYLDNNKQRMQYKTFKNKGYLIGSGAIEAAHRNVIQSRMKRSGQRWTLTGGQQVLNIRTERMSNKWKNVVNLIRNAA